MNYLRWRMLLLAAWLTLLFNIDRGDIDRLARLHVAPFVYVLAAAVIGIMMLIPIRRGQMYMLIVAVLAVYCLLKAISTPDLFVAANKYLTIVEALALAISAYLAWMIGQVTRDFDQAVEAMSLPNDRPRLVDYSKLEALLNSVIAYARRYKRPISVAVIELDPSTSPAQLQQAVREAQAALLHRYAQVQFGAMLSQHIRETDVLVHQDREGHFVLIAPEAAAPETAQMLARLAQMIGERTGIQFRYSIADFPNMALTPEELIHKARQGLLAVPQALGLNEQFRPADSGAAGAEGATMPTIVRHAGAEHAQPEHMIRPEP